MQFVCPYCLCALSSLEDCAPYKNPPLLLLLNFDAILEGKTTFRPKSFCPIVVCPKYFCSI